MHFYFEQQLSLKINLLKSPRRLDTAPQSLTTLGDPVAAHPILSLPFLLQGELGLKQKIRWEKNIDYGLGVIIMKIVM